MPHSGNRPWRGVPTEGRDRQHRHEDVTGARSGATRVQATGDREDSNGMRGVMGDREETVWEMVRDTGFEPVTPTVSR